MSKITGLAVSQVFGGVVAQPTHSLVAQEWRTPSCLVQELKRGFFTRLRSQSTKESRLEVREEMDAVQWEREKKQPNVSGPSVAWLGGVVSSSSYEY